MSTKLTYAEDRLPKNQHYINTRNNRRFETTVVLLTDPIANPTMGCVTGKPGMGKSIAIQKYMQQQMGTKLLVGLPTVVRCKVPTNATAATVARELMLTVGEDPASTGNRHTIATRVAEAIERNGVNLVFIDESDRLNRESFDIIRYIFDKTGCVFVIVGLPKILSVIDKHEQFASRVGLRMEFEKPCLDEVLDLILPNLAIPGWQYIPDNEKDRQLGTEAWRMTGTFRRLRNLLERAGSFCRIEGKNHIDLIALQAAFEYVSTEEERRNQRQSYSCGEMENDSENRNDANK
jgi:DNA transposition AAA+ family ATPase